MKEPKGNKIVDPLCMLCIHTIGGKWGKCDAFPMGIPKEILEGEFDHRKPYKKDNIDDHGLRYEPM